MATQDRIVITGLGAVTPIGIGIEAFWKNLLAGVCGIRTVDAWVEQNLPASVAAFVRDFEPKDFMPAQLAKNAARFAQFAYAAAEQALAQSGLDLSAEPDRIGIAMGTALTGVSVAAKTQEDYSVHDKKKVSPRFVPQFLGNVAASQIAIEKGLRGPCMTVSTACSSGADAIGLARMFIKSGTADAVIAVGADSALSPIVVSSLAMAHALSENTDPAMACKPFDVERNGFVMGEGGSAMILETESHALARGAEILGVLMGTANNTDGFNVVAPAPDGHGEIASMKDALAMAGLSPSDIGYINAHATATPAGDAIECQSVRTVFGEQTPPVGSTKGSTGHMMGAGGVLEAITCLLAVRENVIPYTVGCTQPAAECNANIIYGAPGQAKISYAMSNSFGFGGQNASVIVGEYR